MVGLLDLCPRGQWDVTSAERRGVFGDLRFSRFLQSGEEEGQCGWCVVLSFTSLSFSVWVSSLLVSSAFFWSRRCREICLYKRQISRQRRDQKKLFFCIGSNWVFFASYREGHGLVEKLLLVISIFGQISSTFRYALILCAEAPFFILSQHR